MRITRIDHVAVCVRSIDAALPSWLELLGLEAGAREYVEAQKTEAAFIVTPETAGCTVELIAPLTAGSPLDAASREGPRPASSAAPGGGNPGLEKFLEQRNHKAGLHHIAFAVEDLAGALRELDARGVPLIDKAPRPGARGHLVGFLHPKAADGVLIELVDDHPHRHAQGGH